MVSIYATVHENQWSRCKILTMWNRTVEVPILVIYRYSEHVTWSGCLFCSFTVLYIHLIVLETVYHQIVLVCVICSIVAFCGWWNDIYFSPSTQKIPTKKCICTDSITSTRSNLNGLSPFQKKMNGLSEPRIETT